jgi:hypothetical protein
VVNTKETVIVMALIVNTYLFTEKYMLASELLNLLLLTQWNSENISHTHLYVLVNGETTHVGTAVWARVFECQPAGQKSLCKRRVLLPANSTRIFRRFRLYYSKRSAGTKSPRSSAYLLMQPSPKSTSKFSSKCSPPHVIKI